MSAVNFTRQTFGNARGGPTVSVGAYMAVTFTDSTIASTHHPSSTSAALPHRAFSLSLSRFINGEIVRR